MLRSKTARCNTLLVLLSLVRYSATFSYQAGVCDHEGVMHGLDMFEKQEGNGGFGVHIDGGGKTLKEAGDNQAAAVIIVSGPQPYKGILVQVIDTAAEVALGGWTDLPDSLQAHPMCETHVTHNVEHTVNAVNRDDLHYLPPMLPAGTEVSVQVTLVIQYDTWYAFEQTYTVGEWDPAGQPDAIPLGEGGGAARTPEEEGAQAPGEQGARAPGEGAHAPGEAPALQAAQPVGVVPAGVKAEAKAAFLSGPTAARLHALLMTLSFVYLGPIGALIARYMKHRDPLWIQLHKNLQMAACVAALVALWLALTYMAPFGNAPYFHGQLGLLAVLLMTVQPINGYLRPGKMSNSRPLWRMAHVYLGRGAVVVGTVNVFSGLQIAYEHGWGNVGLSALVVGCSVGGIVGAIVTLESKKRQMEEKIRTENKV